MVVRNESNLTGEVKGHRFTTMALPSRDEGTGSGLRSQGPAETARQQEEQVHVVWKEGKAWRLRLLARGNDPWALPGQEVLFDQTRIEESLAAGRAVIVVSGPHSGLTSFYHWLTYGVGNSHVLQVDLRKAMLRGTTSKERIQFVDKALRSESRRLFENFEEPEDLSEPLDLIEYLAEKVDAFSLSALAFRGFEALDEETAQRFFGHLRALLEDTQRPLGSLGIILLGQSVDALDQKEDAPISPLLSLSDLYAPTGFHLEEVRQMCKAEKVKERLPDIPKREFEKLLEWTGREPVLVHAALQLLSDEGGERRCRNVSQAIAFLARERLPAFEIWVQALTRQLKEQPTVAKIVEQLLRRKKYPNDSGVRISLMTLFVDNWIRLDEDDNVWRWRSDCRRMLAAEAHTELHFG